jgi:predicted ATPase
MVDNSQGRYLVLDLNPELFSSTFKIHTNWHVITGSPCSGKTTLIDQLAGIGYQTANETAREYFAIEMAKGRTSQEIRDSGYPTQMGIFGMQQRLENELSPAEVVFLDRGLPDSLTFHRVYGLNPDELLPECFKHRYASVFLLDRMPFTREVKLGIEEEQPARFIDKWLELDYAALGYNVVRVPVYPPQERLAFVLENISALDQS